jgi:ectoine hydroxylase-related dioxygenase (phytanoyl-CoA dioxygenase family)
LYLNDVTNENGPFELILDSNKLLFNFNLFFKTNKKFPDTRFENDEVMKIINFNKEKILRITGKAGTLILVDTSLLHRGAPVKKGNRYALTNYFYPSYALHMHQNSFVPRISHPLY